MRETIRSSIQRNQIRETFGSVRFNQFLTMRMNKKVSIEDGEQVLNRWDYYVNRKMVGRRFTKEKNLHRRQVVMGCSGFDTNGQLHFHLNIIVPSDWNTGRYKEVCEEVFQSIVPNGTIYFSTNDKGWFDEKDNQNLINYTTKFGHLGVNELGEIDTSSVFMSRNIGLEV